MSGATGNKELELTFKKRLVISVTLSILFGLGWAIGLAGTRSLSVNYLRYSFQIVFVVLSAFQGLFIFIAYGLRLQKVRLIWLKWLYIVVGKHDLALSIATRDTVRFSRPQFNHNMTLGTFDSNNGVELKKFGAAFQSSPALSCRSSLETSPYGGRKVCSKRELSPLALRHKHTSPESTKNGSLKPEGSNRLLVPSRGHSPSLVGSLSMSSMNSSTSNTETDRVTPNTDRVTPNTDRVTPNTDRVTPNTGRVTPNTDRVTPNTDRVTPNTDRVTPNTGRVTPNTDRVTPNTDRVTPNTDRVTPNTDRRSYCVPFSRSSDSTQQGTWWSGALYSCHTPHTLVTPPQGDAAYWYNLFKSGEGDYSTRHAGCPVLVGSKWGKLSRIHSNHF